MTAQQPARGTRNQRKRNEEVHLEKTPIRVSDVASSCLAAFLLPLILAGRRAGPQLSGGARIGARARGPGAGCGCRGCPIGKRPDGIVR